MAEVLAVLTQVMAVVIVVMAEVLRLTEVAAVVELQMFILRGLAVPVSSSFVTLIPRLH
jgi:hypothetical protein